MSKRTIILFCITIFIFIGLKLIYREMDNNDLRLLLAPTNLGVELFCGTKALYSAELGYFHSRINIVIDRSCSGFNFFLIAFLMLVYAFYRIKGIRYCIILPLSLSVAYLLTIAANISRIISYLALLKLNIPKLIDTENTWLHRAEGILVYVFFLLITYLIIDRITLKLNNNEEFIKS